MIRGLNQKAHQKFCPATVAFCIHHWVVLESLISVLPQAIKLKLLILGRKPLFHFSGPSLCFPFSQPLGDHHLQLLWDNQLYLLPSIGREKTYK